MLQDRRFTRLSLLAALSLVVLFQAACMNTPTFSHQGRLLGADGNPVPDGNYTIKYEIFQTQTAGTAVYSETKTNVPVKNGLFDTSLGAVDPGARIDPTIFDRPTYLQITVNGTALTPRQRMQGSPFAFSLASGAVVQGQEKLARNYQGQTNTGATLTVVNTDNTAAGGAGLNVINQTSPEGLFVDRSNNAAFKALANGTTYAAYIKSNGYGALNVNGASGLYEAVFTGGTGILVSGGSCNGCTMSYLAHNVGGAPIQAGEFVAVEGVIADADTGAPVMQVRVATSPSDAIIGVAMGAMSRIPISHSDGTRSVEFQGATGAAAADGYLAVAVQGLVQARAADAGLQPGTTVTAGTNGAEATSAGGFARALSAVDKDGLVWVMLGGQ